MKLIELSIVIFIFIGVILLLLSSAVEALHLNDRGWSKPKFICTLESTGLWFVGIAGFTILSCSVILNI